MGAMFLISIVGRSSTQAYATDHWQCIRTPHYDIIFLDEMHREAQRLANTLETLYLPISKTLQVKPTHIPILLRSRSAISNGFVTLGPPRRAVFYNFPLASSKLQLANEWFHVLAVHELRHVAQLEYWLTRYSPIDLSFALPDQAWLHEGDAVGIETALTTGGRGRSPYFSLLYKVNLLEQGGFSYYKQMIGSYQHQVPDRYQLGYFMTTYLRRKYGADIIRQLLLRESLWEHLNPFTLYNRLKKLTGKSIIRIYQDANNELKKLWEQQLQGLRITPYQPIAERITDDYTDYNYPQPTQDGVIVLKSGIDTPTQFVKIDAQGHEDIICTPVGIAPQERFSVAKDQICWIWYQDGYPVDEEKPSSKTIQIYNLKTQQFTTIASPHRYHTASLSPDGTQIAACITDEGFNHYLQLLHTTTGKLIKQLPNPENDYFLTPSWSMDGKHIVAVKHARSKATITYINSQTGAMQDLLPYTTEAIDNPILRGEYVYYSSSYSGIDNIYAIHLKTKQRFQVTSSKYGAYHPAISADGKWLLYNDFGKNGMNAVKISLNPQQWTPITQVQDRSIRYYQPLVTQEDNAGVLNKVLNVVYPTEAYKPLENLLIYKELAYKPLLNGTAELILSNLFQDWRWTMLGLQYNQDKAATRLFTRLTYQVWKPTLSVDLSLLRIKQPVQGKANYSQEIGLSIHMPWRWYEGAYTNHLILKTRSQVNTWNVPTKWYVAQDYIVHWARKSAKSHRDIRSPWGQTFKMDYTHVWNRPSIQQYAAQCKLYFPGLGRHHSFRAGISYQYKNTPLLFWDAPELKLHHLSYTKDHQLGFCIDYWFPIAYPDWGPMPYVLIKRIGTNLVYDYAYDLNGKKPYHSIGVDLTMDISWLHVGFNLMYRITEHKPDFGVS
jgi:hypothetical protein